ncbi:ABC transporter ATP-binding protein [Angustibacter luteus]|uniref:ABC transporter ATP-binding protein n=1 Tax=Angustibacter luteus TaxID=658456 RepID=A0ABW1JHN4_9ACTN
MTAALQVRGLTAGYGAVPVLRDLDLDVPPRMVVAVLGANGAGKTTLLRALTGGALTSSGQITYGGHDLSRVAVSDLVRLGIAHVPEGRAVITDLTVDENLRLGGLWRDDRKAQRQDLSRVYDLFEPLARRRSYPGHLLSGGERQMLGIGRALMSRPTLMLLDEPSLGLAPQTTAAIMALLATLRDDQGISVLLVEQNVGGALSIADRAVVLSLGRVVVSTTPQELAGDDRARHAYLGY